MNNTRGIIECLFKDIPIEQIIDLITKEKTTKLDKFFFKKLKPLLISYSSSIFVNYSLNERENVIKEFEDKFNNENRFESIFDLIWEFNNKTLTQDGYKPMIRYSQLLRWRELSHKLGQDFFVTSYLACNDEKGGRVRSNLTWPVVISTDNTRLHKMLGKGMAENHFHLKGSAPYFDLIWISLMNRIEDRKGEYKATGMLSNRLVGDTYYYDGIKSQNIYILVLKAALIRVTLFEVINGIKDITDEENSYNMLFKIISMGELELVLQINKYKRKINLYKYLYGVEFELLENKGVIDYTIKKEDFKETNNNFKKYLFGERKFLYDCFYEIYKKDDSKGFKKYEAFFYVYCMIKRKLRAELIQVNDKVGFKNFAEYQDRKGIFLKKDPILGSAVYSMAIEASREDQNIKSFESRICEEDSTENTNSEVKKIDETIRKSKVKFNILGRYEDILNKRKKVEFKNNYFYVMHIVKLRDKATEKCLSKGKMDYILIRDSERREKAKSVAMQLMDIRNRNLESGKRILGIDGCANEMDCRPEAFAQAFRLLRMHTAREEFKFIDNEDENKINSLKVTFHAGEDFLDVVDGLRYIDETIKFIGLKHGERLGHALALGVDVKDWYTFKGNRITLSKQNYLDNIVWLINNIKKYGMGECAGLTYKLEIEYYKYYSYIIGGTSLDNSIYYKSWLLRGDNPKLYRSGLFKDEQKITFWDRCAINTNIKGELRNDENIAKLYYMYHYDFGVRKRGAEIISVKICDDYIAATKMVQIKLREKVRDLGIGIECNPSSNFLISTFKRYDKHPLITFYNKELVNGHTSSPQMFVSINTDDQGVFATSLENEYALMALSLEKAKDINGNRLYEQENIYDWLDKIRRMGLQQSFEEEGV